MVTMITDNKWELLKKWLTEQVDSNTIILSNERDDVDYHKYISARNNQVKEVISVMNKIERDNG
jgi:hypothetical protein